jgi:hypothetical protein
VMRRGSTAVAANLAPHPTRVPLRGDEILLSTAPGATAAGDLPAESAAVLAL